MVALISQNLGDVELDELVREGLTAEDWIFAAAVFVGSVVLAKVIERICPRVLLGGEMDAGLATLIARFIRNLIIVVGFIYALVILRVQIGPLLGVLGLLVVAVALAAQAIIENFFASVVLKTRRPFVAGEEILTNGADR